MTARSARTTSGLARPAFAARTARRVAAVLLAATAAVALSGCPNKAVEEGTKAIPQANNLMCHEDRRILEDAVENYTLLEGDPPASEQAMVSAYLRVESTLYDYDPATGTVVPAPGSSCT
ncbi:MAG: hypothetical protein Q7V88_01160 [Actinomycetota bacterium]|nr:hypothetical protein [Actinomycetota bacterium]